MKKPERMINSMNDIRTFEDVLDKDGVLVYTNVGVSMLPLLREKKDVIEIKRKGEERCKKYDVVLYKRGRKYILHRIIKVLPNGYLIVGDNCVRIEDDIKDENILGVVTRIIRNGKTIMPDNLLYKIYVYLWCGCYPVRFIVLKAKKFIYRCLRHIKRKIFG